MPRRNVIPSALGCFATILLCPTHLPAQQRAPGVVSPEVTADHHVIFRIAAPKAQEVTVNTEWDGKRSPLIKGDNGVWSVTLGPVDENIYTYQFNVDGVPTLDPRNNQVKIATPVASLVEVGGPSSFFGLRDVPHGVVDVIRYHSKSLDVERRMHVYTPPGYDDNAGQKYPVLYLLHGSGDNDGHWSELGRANLILDNLISEKKAVPMIVVIPHGHAQFAHAAKAGPAARRCVYRRLHEGRDAVRRKALPHPN